MSRELETVALWRDGGGGLWMGGGAGRNARGTG